MKRPGRGAPKANDFTEGDLTSIVPVFKDDVDSDEEEVRLRKHLQEDFNEAADADWSPVYSVRPLTRSQESTNGRPSMTRAPTSSTNIFDRDDNVESHTEVDYGGEHDDGIQVVDEFPEPVVIPDDAMDRDQGGGRCSGRCHGD